ncbi:MAG: TetR/AcrR family transcriptional regulator [Nitrospirae bacterium]|nr:MAG: TetR/AcrR family transcriptional regulator [Nitrospirota bacterium]
MGSLTSTHPRLPRAQRKAAILTAATRLFAAKGFSGTKTREIAELAGISEALLFKHFPTKKDLFAAILAQYSPVPRLLTEVQALAHEKNDEQLFRYIATTIVSKVPDTQLMRLILFSALEEPELSDLFFHQHVSRFYKVFSQYIARRIKDGALASCDPLLAARAFMGMLINHRLLSDIFHLPVPHSPEMIAETIVRIFLHGMRVTAPNSASTASGITRLGASESYSSKASPSRHHSPRRKRQRS